ncbi:hypothetical protein FOCC_FOCC015156, partial [Frankliniella occidentalis]
MSLHLWRKYINIFSTKISNLTLLIFTDVCSIKLDIPKNCAFRYNNSLFALIEYRHRGVLHQQTLNARDLRVILNKTRGKNSRSAPSVRSPLLLLLRASESKANLCTA